jgi:hypothetical protein
VTTTAGNGDTHGVESHPQNAGWVAVNLGRRGCMRVGRTSPKSVGRKAEVQKVDSSLARTDFRIPSQGAQDEPPLGAALRDEQRSNFGT